MKAAAKLGCVSVLCLLWAVGCGKSPTTTASSGSVPANRPQGDGPDAAVFDFLEAVRTGNDAQAGSMLTPLAQQKVAEQNLVVSPPGTDTASFTVGAVERLAEDGARVTVQWTDLDENGKPHTDEVIWMVRKVPVGWRIAGVAAPVFEGEPPLLLDFEDPEDMLRKQKLVREEMRRRAGESSQPPAAEAAQNPDGLRR
jgi:hypothetical protein